MRKFIFFSYLSITICFAQVIANPEFKAHRIPIGDEIAPRAFFRYSDDRQSPGVQVGETTYELQRHGSHGQRIAVDDSNQIHVNWTHCAGTYPGNPRFVQWNFRYPDGSWHGETDASPSVSGFCQLDIMIADSGLAKRTMNVWHYYGYSWVSIDEGSGLGSWPGDTGSPHVSDHIWPTACVASNNNIIMGTQDTGGDYFHFYLTTDEGKTWDNFANFDSSRIESQFPRASRNPRSQKVVIVWHQSIAYEFVGWLISQMAQDVWYMLSTDNGVTWGPQINVTNFTPPVQMVNGDTTFWAYCDVNAVFDTDDNLHIAFAGNLGYMLNDTYYFGDHAKIFHWDEVSDTITVINSPSIYYYEPGGWWLDVSAGFRQHTESWRLPIDQPQLVVDPLDNTLFCLWHGQDDTTDYSAGGYFSGELYGSYSSDGGLTWSDYVNLTNTRSPGADSGDCFDEDYMTAWPYVANDSIYITYVEDKDAGFVISEGTAWTVNPVRVWIFHKGLILGTEEQKTYRPEEHTTPSLEVYPNPFHNMTNIKYGITDHSDINIKIYDITGKLVKDFERIMHIIWDGTDNTDKKLPSGIYFLEFKAGDYTETKKLILLR